MISNLLPSWLFVRIGGTDIPSASSCDWAIPPMTAQIIPLPATNIISVGVGVPLVTLGQQVMAGQGAIVTLYDVPTPVAVGSMDLNPSRMGQMTQRTFTVPTSYTLPFPVTTVHVANYSNAWLYAGINTLVAPTVITASIAIPPMTEKSLPCQPTALFAFAFSAALVTLGDQVPAGMKVIATFYEYPTSVGVGTADLNPSKMGKMSQRTFTVPSSFTEAFSVTTVHVANYSTSWLYVGLGTLVVPTVVTCSVAIPPMSEKSISCLPNTQFAFGFSAALVTLGDQVPAGMRVIATFYEYPTSVGVGTADLNPSKMGQSTQSIFVANFNRTLAFRATSIHVSNYSSKWVYVAYGLLLPFPTAANAMGSVPPFSERNLPCPPNVDFSFGFSAATIMIGTDIPQTNVVATFYEYPVPMALGAASLSPGGFRYREALHLPAAAVAHNTVIERDLSNFTWAKYTAAPNMPANTLKILFLDIFDLTIPSTSNLVGSLPPLQNYPAALTFHAGKKIWIVYEVSDMTNFTLIDWLEAW